MRLSSRSPTTRGPPRDDGLIVFDLHDDALRANIFVTPLPPAALSSKALRSAMANARGVSTARPYSSAAPDSATPLSLQERLAGLGVGESVVAKMRNSLRPGAASLAGPAGPGGAAELRRAERAVQRAAARLQTAAAQVSAAVGAAFRESSGRTVAPLRADLETQAAPSDPVLDEGYLARERERWGQGSWRREHLRAEGPGLRGQRAAWEDEQMENQRLAGEQKLAQLLAAKGIAADKSAPLPPNVARRDGVAPLGARAQAEEAKRLRAAEAAAAVAAAAEAAAARDAAAASLSAAAAAKASAFSEGAWEKARAAMEAAAKAEQQASGLPSQTAAPQSQSACPPPAPPAAPRARGGGTDMRRRREVEASAERERVRDGGGGGQAAAAAALRAELEAESARAMAQMAARGEVGADCGPSDGVAPPQCNAPHCLLRGDSQLEVCWSVGAGRDDCAAFQLQRQGPGQAWLTVTEDARQMRLLLTGLQPGTTYTMRVRARAHGGAWGPYSAPATAATTGQPPADAPRPQPRVGAGGSVPEYEALHARTAAFMASSAATQTQEVVAAGLAAHATTEQQQRALLVATAELRASICAIRGAQGSAESAARQLKMLRVRYHPDKAAPQERWLYEELSKVVNAETAD